ncbi:MAG: type 1 glutamine amidotransferase domain-containing protein [Actinomycetes bacterium]
MATVAFILDDLFEDSEFQVPYDEVVKAGHQALVVGLEKGKEITGKKGSTVTVEYAVGDVDPAQVDALVIPGGYSPDKIRTDPGMVALTQKSMASSKPVAAICHAGWMLAEADVVRGKRVTSFHSIKTDLVNAGATWVDEEVVEDGNLITSRTPRDLPAFCSALVKQLG